MTEENTVYDTEEVFKALSVTRILIAVIQTLGEITVSTDLFLNNTAEDKELEVDYNPDEQTFTFKLKELIK
jgi:hypothetical protein